MNRFRPCLAAVLVALGTASYAPTAGAHPLDCERPAIECEGDLGNAFGLGLGQQVLGPFCNVEGPIFLEGFVYEITVVTRTRLTLWQDTNPDSMSSVFLLSHCETDSCAAFTGGQSGEDLAACVEPGVYYAVIVTTDPLNAPATFRVGARCGECGLVPSRRSTWGLLKSRHGPARSR